MDMPTSPQGRLSFWVVAVLTFLSVLFSIAFVNAPVGWGVPPVLALLAWFGIGWFGAGSAGERHYRPEVGQRRAS